MPLLPKHALVALLALTMAVLNGLSEAAVSPSSPEVQDLVKRGLKFLASEKEERLGGKCVIALAFLKTKPAQPNHPKVKEALAACVAESKRPDPKLDMYSNGLAAIFLCELNPRLHSNLVQYFLGRLEKRQKGHGGWGYDVKETGDTSQSQYAALTYWEAHNNGFRIQADSAAKLADWLIHSQDPSGGWGYQGKYAPGDQRVKQSGITCSMLAAAMGSALICTDLFGMLNPGQPGQPGAPVDTAPAALRIAGEKERRRAPSLSSASLDRGALLNAIKLGNKWFDANYKVDIGRYNIYYLYSLERYKSFQEILDGFSPPEPAWYVNGYKFLKSKQGEDGSWTAGCGRGPDTAFGILFLVRSTKQILNKPVGDLRVGARGLPQLSSGAQLKNGEFVIKQTQAALGDLMDMLDAEASEKLDALANDPTALMVTGEVDEATAQRLRQLVRAGSPSARLIATRTLGRTGRLDEAPTLIYAMTDPDERVVLAARDGLRFISRRFVGFGLKDRFTDRERYGAIDKWKGWYLSIRPDAVVTLE